MYYSKTICLNESMSYKLVSIYRIKTFYYFQPENIDISEIISR